MAVPVDWDQDEELQAIFRTEMEERVPHLIEGALAMIEGTLTAELTEQCAREAHTIKGTAKVMGFAVIGDAGGRLEEDWKAIQEHTLHPTAQLGRRFLAVSRSLIPAIDADPEQGSPDLSGALRALINGEEPPPPVESAPAGNSLDTPPVITLDKDSPDSVGEPVETVSGPSLIVIDGAKDESTPINPNVGNLGGLLATTETFALGQTTGVDTTKLYRLINRVAELRLDVEALSGTVEALRMAATSSPREVASLASRWEAAVVDINDAVSEIQQQAVTLVAVPISTVTGTVPGLVRFLAKKTGREVRLEIVDDNIEVDLQILESLADAFRNLIVNAIEHGIENPEERMAAGKPGTGTLSIAAAVEDGRLSLTVSDDGRGMDWAALRQTAISNNLIEPGEISEEQIRILLFETGISTSPAHSELSGSGQGFNNVAKLVRDMRGSVRLQTDPGVGTTVTITVPAFQSLQRALIIESAGRRWGLAEPAVLDRFSILDAERVTVAGSQEVVWGDGMLPIGSFAAAAGLQDTEAHRDVVVVATQAGPAALAVTSIMGVREVATKSLGPLVSGTDLITGAALLGGGELALMLDANALGEASRQSRSGIVPDQLPRVLVVDDSPGVRQIVAGAIAAGGFDAVVAGSAEEALQIVSEQNVDAIVVDYSMPGSDGIALVQGVRARSTTLPVVMMSAVAEREDQDRAKAAGVDVYFDKSDFREGALVSTLHSLLERADKGQEAQAR